MRVKFFINNKKIIFLIYYSKLHSTCVDSITGEYLQKNPSPCGFSSTAYHCEASSASAKEHMIKHNNQYVCSSTTRWNGPNNGITGKILNKVFF